MKEGEKFEIPKVEPVFYEPEPIVPKIAPVRETIDKLKKEGYDIWFENDEKIVFGKVLYEDGYGDLQDWEEVTVDKRTGEVQRRYETNRDVPGWEFDPETGEWCRSL